MASYSLRNEVGGTGPAAASRHLVVVPDGRHNAMPSEQLADLKQVLADLLIDGEITAVSGSAAACEVELQLAPRTKVRRAILLADDIAHGMGALTGSAVAVGPATLSLRLQFRSYLDLSPRLLSPV